MIPYMKGQKEDLKLSYCIGAKVCSGKAPTEEEAREICLTTPKEEKPAKARTSRKAIDIQKMVACATPKIISKIESDAEITEDLISMIFNSCVVTKGKTLSKEKFIKKCFKENSSTGTTDVSMPEGARLRSFCVKEYKKLQEDNEEA